MKKYRPIKLSCILLIVLIIGLLLGVFLLEGWQQVLMLLCTCIMLFGFILSITYYIQFKEEEIVIRHGLSSFNKAYRSNFKTRHIPLNDIKQLSIDAPNRYVIILLFDGKNIMLNFNGYFKTSEIINEFQNVKNRLNNRPNIELR